MIHQIELKVRGYHLDLYGHVNNARYLEFLEEARWAFMEEKGDLETIVASHLALVVVNININYRKPATMGDEVQIRTHVKKIGSKSVRMYQEIVFKKTGAVVADADITFVLFDSEENKAISITGKWKDMLQGLIPE